MKYFSTIFFSCVMALFALSSCDKESSIEGPSFKFTDPSELSPEERDAFLSELAVGSWESKYSAKYYFLNNNEGYFLLHNDYGGTYFDAFDWCFENGTMIMNFYETPKNGRKRVKVPFSAVAIDSIKISGTLFTRLDYNGFTEYNYHKPPYECYFYAADCYYPMKMVGRKCTHADGYGSSNFKYLRFYGPNEDVEPLGAVILYATPYYEGINSEWPAGYYSLVSSSGYWKYTGYFNYTYNHETIYNGWLKIEDAGDQTIYDFNFNNSEMIGHFIGREQ